MPTMIFRSAHYPEELNDKFEKLFRECDILLVEKRSSKYYNEVKEFYNQLSQKGYSEHALAPDSFDEFSKKLESFIRNSKKQIEVEKSPISLEKFSVFETLQYDAWSIFCKGNLEEACKKRLDAIKYFHKLEEKIDENLIEQSTTLQKKNPKKKILFYTGIGHTLYPELKNRGLEVKQEFPYKPYIFIIVEELYRRLKFDKPYNSELVAKTFSEDAILHYLSDLGYPMRTVTKKSREISEKLSYEDIRDLSAYISETNLHREMLVESTILWLRNKGFEI